MPRCSPASLTMISLILLPTLAARADPTAATAPDAIDPATTQSTTRPTPSTTQSAEIQNLIGQLDADDWHTRRSAEDRLVSLGETVRESIKNLLTTGSAEQRTRAPEILARLDAIIANSPTLITLHVTDANPRDVYAAIAKQAGIEIALFPENLWEKQRGIAVTTVTIDLDRQPFWSAIAQVGQLTNSRLQTMNMGGGGKLTVMQGNPGEDFLTGPQFGTGQYIIKPLQITRNQSITFAPIPSKTSTADIRFKLMVDPKVTIVRLLNRPILTEAMDDKGNSLVPPDLINSGYQEGSSYVFDLDSSLVFQNDGASMLKSLKGTIALTVANRTEHLTVPDVAAAIGKPNSIAGWIITINTFHIDGRSGTITLQAKVPSSPFDPSTAYAVLNQIHLTDAAGHPLSGGNSGSGDNIHYQITRNFSSAADIRLPVSLKWDLASEWKEKQVRFEFKDLPLPTP